MGKELSTVKDPGFVTVGTHRIATGVKTYDGVDELYTPPSNLKEVKNQLVEPLKISSTLSRCSTIGGVGMILAAFPMLGFFPDAPSNILFPIIGSVMGISGFALNRKFWVFSSIEDLHVNSFYDWMKKRYSISIDNKKSGWADVHTAAVKGLTAVLPEGKNTILFTATNGRNYELCQTKEGKLFVKPKMYSTTTAEEAKALEASPVPQVEKSKEFENLHPSIRSLVDSIETDIKVLKHNDLSAEQDHIVTRAADEADRAVKVFTKMRTLNPEADAIDTVDVLSLVSAELAAVKKSIFEELNNELQSVNSYRKQELDVEAQSKDSVF